MSSALPEPAIERCIGALGEQRELLFTVLVKWTFALRDDGTLAPAEAQAPFVSEPRLAAAAETGVQVPQRLPEVTPDRDACDIIVLATARAPHAITQRDVTLEGPLQRRLRIIGDRMVEHRHGNVAFSPPAPWEEMPLGWDRAYGGVDAGVLPREGAALEELLQATHHHPGSYPRNDTGRGYSLAESRLGSDGMPLPNVEDPEDQLTPARFDCPAREQWHLQPRPAGWGWMQPHWFPRALCFGAMPGPWPNTTAHPLPEEALGLLPHGLLETQRAAHAIETAERYDALIVSPGAFQLSAPGMTLPQPRGDETFVFHGLDGDRPLAVPLPGVYPSVTLSLGATIHEPPPRLFHIVFDLDAKIVEMVWGAPTPLHHPQLDDVPPEGLLDVPIRVTARQG